MSDQRHRIRRQVLEIILRDQGAAWQLSSELSRIQRQSLEAIIDRCCSEAGDPDRLHRIESLEVDLGYIDPGRLERDLVEKLGPRLRVALAAQIRAEDQATSLTGADPETISRLELVALFAKTGSLPWWADGSRPRLLDEAIGLLLQRAAGPLIALVRTLARSRGELRRLVLHCEDERLWTLFAALVSSAPRGLAQRSAELRALLTALSEIAGVAPSSFRSAVWVAALRTVSIEESAGADALGFWRETLAHAALELGVTYTLLVASLHENRESIRAGQGEAAAGVVQRLYREVRGESIAGDSAPRESSDDLTRGPAEIEATVDRLEQLGIEPRALFAELLRVLEELAASGPAEAFRETRSLLQGMIEKHTGDGLVADSSAAAVDGDAPVDHSETLAAQAEDPGDVGPDGVETVLDRLERAWILPRALSRELRSLGRRSAARDRIGLLRALEGLEAALPASLSPDVREAAERAAAVVDQAVAISGDRTAGGIESLLARPEAWKDLEQRIASRLIPAHALERALAAREGAAAASPPSRVVGEPPLDLAYADSEDAYVENAGLVILWPFLGHLFERLELMSDQRFKNPPAQHRAVGLLQYMATQDPWPQEYQLVLAKVLCGMSVDEIFDFGPPVTEVEAEESTDMLSAAIANAPILRDMSIDGFRSSFLLRKGVLSTRDGAWLLRVERATHDVVLDRFPWSVSWVKLPWMEAPLSVEW